ncbi:MAG: hypothetical protein AB8F95_07820 [Bacteroidia bacterium]
MSRSPWNSIQQAFSESFPAEGERFAPTLITGMTESELENHRKQFPHGLPEEIALLLENTRGFDVMSLGEIRFDNAPDRDAQIKLCEDEEENTWHVKMDTQSGAWKEVLVRSGSGDMELEQAPNLTSFLEQIFHQAGHEVSWLEHTRKELRRLSQKPAKPSFWKRLFPFL